MFEIRLNTAGFITWLHRAASELDVLSKQALGQSVALALQHARSTTSFHDRTGKLRASLTRGQKSPWVHFLKASAPYAAFVEYDTRPHPIEARRAKTLRFVKAGEVRFARRVNHPGTKGTHFIQRASEVGGHALEDMLERAANRAFR